MSGARRDVSSTAGSKPRAVAAGMISRAVINSTPTSFMANATVNAISTMNVSCMRSDATPSAMAVSSCTVSAINGRQIAASAARITTPPP